MSLVFPHTFVPWFRAVAPYIHAYRGKTFVVALAGEAAYFVPQPFLRLQNGAGAEGITALQRQRMIENVEHPGHAPCHGTGELNAASTEPA